MKIAARAIHQSQYHLVEIKEPEYSGSFGSPVRGSNDIGYIWLLQVL
jgi:hypothetical protein